MSPNGKELSQQDLNRANGATAGTNSTNEAAHDRQRDSQHDRQRDHDRQYREREEGVRGRQLTEDVDIASQLGFSSFGSTKNKKVAGNNQSSAKKNKKAKFRQYMNREKGFNRSLSPQRK